MVAKGLSSGALVKERLRFISNRKTGRGGLGVFSFLHYAQGPCKEGEDAAKAPGAGSTYEGEGE